MRTTETMTALETAAPRPFCSYPQCHKESILSINSYHACKNKRHIDYAMKKALAGSELFRNLIRCAK